MAGRLQPQRGRVASGLVESGRRRRQPPRLVAPAAGRPGPAIKPAADSKDRARLCQAFRTFVAAEAKVIKFVNENAARCGIPADAAKVMKVNHTKSTTIRNQICSAGGPSGPAPAPSLSDALGTSRIPGVTATEPTRGGGTFNTLTGNPLAR